MTPGCVLTDVEITMVTDQSINQSVCSFLDPVLMVLSSVNEMNLNLIVTLYATFCIKTSGCLS